MIIAIPEEEGEIAEHLGKAKTIHFFEIEDGKILKDEIVPCTGQGHEYMLALLSEKKAGVLICGNLGTALMGDVNEAVYEYLDGSLPKVPLEHLLGGHCCHHHHEEEGCHCHCGCHEEDDCCHED